jgi:hypothetical protein
MTQPVEINPSPEDIWWLRELLKRNVTQPGTLNREKARRWLKLLDLMEGARALEGIGLGEK